MGKTTNENAGQVLPQNTDRKSVQTPDAQREAWPLDSQVEDDERHKWEIHPHPFSSDYDYMVTNDDRIALDGILHAAEMYLWDSCEPGDTRKLVVVHNTPPLAYEPDTQTSAASSDRDAAIHGQANPPSSSESIATRIAGIRFDIQETRASSSPMGLFRQHCIDLLNERDLLLSEVDAAYLRAIEDAAKAMEVHYNECGEIDLATEADHLVAVVRALMKPKGGE